MHCSLEVPVGSSLAAWLHFIVLFQLFFTQRWAARTKLINLQVRTTNCRLYSNISQILLLYKTWGIITNLTLWNWNPWGICYWYVEVPQFGYMEHGLEYITFYVQKQMAPLAVCSGLPLVGDGPLGAPEFLKFAYCSQWFICPQHPKKCPLLHPCLSDMTSFDCPSASEAALKNVAEQNIWIP